MKYIFTLVISLACFPAQSAPTNVRVIAGTSKIVGEPITQVWGVMVGVADNSKTAPYNNCNESAKPDDSFEGCNTFRVNGNHTITIEFTESETLEQNVAPIAVIKQIGGTTEGSGRIKVVRQPDTQQARIGANQTGTLNFTWEDLCKQIEQVVGGVTTAGQMQVIEGVNRCVIGDKPVSGNFLVTYGFQTSPGALDTASSTTLSFYLYNPPFDGEDGFVGSISQTCPSGSSGFCDITPFPGDSGGTLAPPENFTARTNRLAGGTSINAPASDSFGAAAPLPLTVEQLRIYYSSLDFQSAHPAANPEQHFNLLLDVPNSNLDAVFRDSDFGGLENGTPYILRAATVDSSGTVSRIFAGDFCPGGSTDTPSACPDYSITPSEVAGLILESSCFITSATYGSPESAQVSLFRQFRAKYLLTNRLGRVVSRTYNRYGPIGAKWIYENPSSRKFIVLGLYPFYGFAFLSLDYGFLTASLIYLLSLVVVVSSLLKIFSKGKLQ